MAVLGPGMRGISAVMAAREAGADFVKVTGYGPRDAERLAWARRFGADLTVDVTVAGLDDLEPLLATMAGEIDDVAPLHGVLVPDRADRPVCPQTTPRPPAAPSAFPR